jgi:hypothetical protein
MASTETMERSNVQEHSYADADDNLSSAVDHQGQDMGEEETSGEATATELDEHFNGQFGENGIGSDEEMDDDDEDDPMTLAAQMLNVDVEEGEGNLELPEQSSEGGDGAADDQAGLVEGDEGQQAADDIMAALLSQVNIQYPLQSQLKGVLLFFVQDS